MTKLFIDQTAIVDDGAQIAKRHQNLAFLSCNGYSRNRK